MNPERRNHLSPTFVPLGQEFLLGLVGFIVALSLLAGIAAIAAQGRENWKSTRYANVQP